MLLDGCARDEFSGPDVDDIREAVFRHQFELNASGAGSDVGARCIGVGDRAQDPSETFLARFVGIVPPVLKSTDCAMDQTRTHLVVVASGQPALRFNCAEIHRRWDGSVDAEGGFYAGNLSASGNEYRLKKVNGKWIVVSDKVNWVA